MNHTQSSHTKFQLNDRVVLNRDLTERGFYINSETDTVVIPKGTLGTVINVPTRNNNDCPTIRWDFEILGEEENYVIPPEFLEVINPNN